MMGKESQIVPGEALADVLSEILDAGRFNEAQPLIESIDVDGLELLRAEYALYLDRLDDVEMLTARADDTESHRARMIRAETSFWRGHTSEAAAAAGSLVAELEASDGDVAIETRARILEARCALRQNELDAANEKLRSPAKLAHAARNVYLQAFVAYVRAMIALKTPNGKNRVELFSEAVDLFARAGARRWEGHSRALRGSVYANDGRFEEALAECDIAVNVATDLGIWRDAIWAEHTAARVLLLAGDTRKAIARLEPLLSDERWCENGYAELNTLYTLAYGRVIANDVAETAALGSEIERLAALVKSEVTPFDGRLLSSWASARAGASGGLDELCACALQAADLDRDHVADATVLLADCLTRQHAEIAGPIAAAVAKMPEFEDRELTRLVYRRLSHDIAEGPVAVLLGATPKITLDALHPDSRSALDRAERFFLVSAYLEAGGVQAEAARLMGLKVRANFHALWKKMKGEMPALVAVLEGAARPGRSRQQHAKYSNQGEHVGKRGRRGRGDLAISALPLTAAGGGDGNE